MKAKTKDIWNKTQGHCIYCDRHRNEICQSSPELPPCFLLTVDHIVPASMGGTRLFFNLMPACRPCNLRRATAWPASPLAHERWRPRVEEAERKCTAKMAGWEAMRKWQRDWRERRLLQDFERLMQPPARLSPDSTSRFDPTP